MMIVVIIAGGSGTRLWPLSTPEYPKHLLKINGDDRSLLQQTYDRARRLTDKLYVVSEKSHIEHIRQQLPDLAEDCFIVEPDRRGTANCIVAALAYISKKHDHNEAIAFIHSDHYIHDNAGFSHSFRLAGKVSSRESRIVLVGIEPDRAATGFGYIEKGDLLDEQSLVFNVRSFKEKPDSNTARQYIKSGNYLWNAGYFLGSLEVFLASMKSFAPELLERYQELLSAEPSEYERFYLEFKPEAIDYALIEKMPNLLVVPAAFDWMDLGSFGDLAKAIGGDDKGNNLLGEKIEIEDVKNSLIHNEEQKPVAVIGLDNVAVINTPQGLLVVRKDLSQKVGDVSKRLNKS